MMAELSEEQPAKAAVPIDSTDLSDIHTSHGQHTSIRNRTIVTVPCMYSMTYPGTNSEVSLVVKKAEIPMDVTALESE